MAFLMELGLLLFLPAQLQFALCPAILVVWRLLENSHLRDRVENQLGS
eukprot:Gb_08305 [translate_table: standard]